MSERVYERGQNACARGADRMAERAGAAVHVHLRMIELEIVHRSHGDARESFVDFVEVDVASIPARAFEHRTNRADRRRREPLGRLRVARVCNDAGERLEPMRFHGARACDR